MPGRFKLTISRLSLSKMLMVSTIVLIAAFQAYWINKLYNEEWDGLKKETDIAFRDVMYKLQLKRFRKDTTFFSGQMPDNLFLFNVIDSIKGKTTGPQIRRKIGINGSQLMVSVEANIQHDSLLNGKDTFFRQEAGMQAGFPFPPSTAQQHIIRYFNGNSTINTPLDTKQIDSAYQIELLKSGINVPCTVQMITGNANDIEKKINAGEFKTSFIFVGLSNAYAYQATFGNAFGYIVGKLKLPVLVGLLLIAITIVSFVFLYRGLLAQQRLATLKNEFISNITHELKTPIATVNVAIEALRNFNALQNPERTKEYLDISALELQRLSMLVDKVLKLSMFENKEIELNKENINLHQLAAEVIAAMKLQFEKAGALIQLTKDAGDFTVKADRLHITSVLYNLLDNALKYSKEKPAITVHLYRDGQFAAIEVCDNGIGISPAYKDKIFEKFFRVPSGDHHNIKGYGLGLSYVHHIVTKHDGLINVESTPGKGSTFTIKLPAI
jgi:two-component system phosphate regulon sensor histidine kinase PhoR